MALRAGTRIFCANRAAILRTAGSVGARPTGRRRYAWRGRYAPRGRRVWPRFACVLASERCTEVPRAPRMGQKKEKQNKVSRRTFLGGMRWAPLLFLPAPVHSAEFGSFSSRMFEELGPSFPLSDFRFKPHYPAKSPLDDILRYVEPGSDEYETEKYAAEIAQRLEEWGRELRSGRSRVDVLAKLLGVSFQAGSLTPIQENKRKQCYGHCKVRSSFLWS